MSQNKWIMLPESYQPDTKDSREESGLKYAKYYHESAYEELKAQLQDHMPFDAYYLNWEVERGQLLADVERLEEIHKGLSKERQIMIDEKAKLKLMTESYRANLLMYGSHLSDCAGWKHDPLNEFDIPCTCGFEEEARKALEGK